MSHGWHTVTRRKTVKNNSLGFPLPFPFNIYGVVMRTNIAFRTNRKGLNMTTETRFTKLLAATPDTLVKIDCLLEGRPQPEQPETGDRRLLTLMEAARELNVSRMTVHRMCRDGRLPTITTRAGRRRIASHAITEFLKGGAA